MDLLLDPGSTGCDDDQVARRRRQRQRRDDGRSDHGRSRTTVLPVLDLGRHAHRQPGGRLRQPVELGLKFRSDTDGFITGVRFYKTSENTGTHIGHLWTVGGTLLGRSPSPASPHPVAAGRLRKPGRDQGRYHLLVSYHAPTGHYAAIASFFSLVGFDNPRCMRWRTGSTVRTASTTTAPRAGCSTTAGLTPSKRRTTWSTRLHRRIGSRHDAARRQQPDPDRGGHRSRHRNRSERDV